jgi:hypothetical protein
METNDAQIDLLMRRYARHAESHAATEHLDADELNAFTEGTLPSATRARYVSHLVECDDCRQVATQLAIASGATGKVEAAWPREAVTRSRWQKLTILFALPKLRYAAFAVLLVAAAGVLFLALRHRREATLVARSEPTSQTPVSALKPAEESGSQAGQKAQNYADRSGTVSESAQNSNLNSKRDESKAAENSAPPPKLEKETAPSTGNPALEVRRAAEPAIAQSSPSFAPPPPNERAEIRSRDQQNAGGIAGATGPRKIQSPSDKMLERVRTGETSKDRPSESKENRTATNQPMRARAPEAKPEAQKRSTLAGSLASERSADAAATVTTGGTAAEKEKAAETRSVGGHKFRRQGNTWVDVKFKPGMSASSVSRGSDEFRALDSDLRSIAQQLSGEIIVVRKGKAYRIR